MKFAPIAVASLVLAAPAVAQERAALGSLARTPTSFLGTAEVLSRADHTLIIPASSIHRNQDAGRLVHTNTRVLLPNASASRAAVSAQSIAPAAGLPPYLGYAYETPATLACLYGLVTAANGCKPDSFTTVATGGSKAIAIVDAYHYPNALADLTAYSAQFGLPTPTASTFQQVNLGGSTVNDGWAQEAALDIQMAHALAPKAKIILVEAASPSFTDMLAAVDKASALVAAAGGGQVSMSWGSGEFSGESTADTHFQTANVVYFASSGDNVYPGWPAASAKVVAVGGTTIARDPKTLAFLGEDSWTSAGAGFSTQVARPAFQPTTVGTMRGLPDISAIANPETGVWVRYTYAGKTAGQWMVFGGTSVAAPVMAAVVNASGHFYASSTAQNTKMYANKTANVNAFRISRTGDCGYQHAYIVSSGWNPCTGVGSPIGVANQ